MNWESAIDGLKRTEDSRLKKRLLDLLHEEVRMGRIDSDRLQEIIASAYRETSDPWLSTELKRLQNRMRSRKVLGRDLLRLREAPKNDEERARLWEDLRSLKSLYEKSSRGKETLEAGYDVHEMIGEGGMSVVFRAVRRSDNMPVAIKYLRDRFFSNPASVSRFEREGRLSLAFDHPNIVRVFETGEHQGRMFLIMEYLPIGGLDLFIKSEDLDLPLMLASIRQAAGALAYVHLRNLVHRDVKLSNLLVAQWAPQDHGNSDERIQVKLSDFGLCKDLGVESFTKEGTTMGTEYYSAPELVIDPAHVDHRADIFSLGVALFRLVSRGAFPVGEFKPLKHFAPSVPFELDHIVKRCVRPDPSERYPSMEAIASDIAETERQLKECARPLLSSWEAL